MASPQLTLSDDAQNIADAFEEYAYSVSHDLSAPVRAMVEFSRLLEQESSDALSDEAREYLHYITESGKKMQAMMEGLLTYSRLNTLKGTVSEVALGDVLERACYALKEKVEATGAVIDFNALPTLYGDEAQLTLLMQTLLDNAMTYQQSDSRPHIHVNATQMDNRWQICVADNGIGVAEKHASRIFKLFQRLHTDTEYPGVGVGLTLANKIIDRHGGKLWVERNEPHGSLFLFTLEQNMLSASGEQ